MQISAVILSYNSRRYLAGCIDGLAEVLGQLPGPHEIFVIENGSTDGSRQILEALAGRHVGLVKPIYCDRNTGTTVSRNMALRKATGRWILVMDSDATANLDALRRLIAHLEAHPRCGLAVPQLRYPDGRFQLSTDVFPTPARKVSRLLNLRGMEAAAQAPDAPVAVDYAISAFWLLRAQAVRDTGLLDERIFYSPEDVDYCVRLWLAGWCIDWVPDAVAVHDAQEISRAKKLNGFLFRHAAGLAYYFSKHGCWLGRQGLQRRITLRQEERSA